LVPSARPDADILRGIYRPIREEMRRVQGLLEQAVEESSPVIRPMGRHLLKGSGKRIRAALVLFAARSGGKRTALAFELAAAVEMLHVASLVHDDILDGSELRRNVRTLNAAWGTRRSVLMGDYLVVSNFCRLADRVPPAVTQDLLRAAQLLCDGEIEETAMAFRPEITEKRYLSIIAKKTAALTASATWSGAALASAPPHLQNSLRRFGQAFGMAFQLVDDALDYSGDPDEMGKPVGTDLTDGKFTMPVLYLKGALGGREKGRLMRLLSRQALSNGGAAEVVALVRKKGGLAFTFARAGAYIRAAIAAIGDAPVRVRMPLAEMADFILARRS
jgi:geranylgeranyl pyrophosphate synthase